MKIAHLFAAATLVAASLGTATAAEAQYRNGDRHQDVRYDQRSHTDRRDNHQWNGRDRDRRGSHYDRHDNGNHYGWRNGNHYGWRNGRGDHYRCRMIWRHHRQMRVCR